MTQPRFTSLLVKVNRRLTGWLLTLLVVLLATLFAIAVVDIVGWLVWKSSWALAGEIQGILLVWLALLGAAWGVAEGQHLSLGLIVDRVPQRYRGLFLRFASFVVACFGFGLASYGYRLAVVVTNTLPATGWPAAVQYLPAVVSGSLIALFGLARSITGIQGVEEDQ